MLKSFVFTHCAVESRSNNLYFKSRSLCTLVMMAALKMLTREVCHLTSQDFDCKDRCLHFQGPHAQPDTIGHKFCLSLGVVPVFAPPREHGMQNAIEGFKPACSASEGLEGTMEALNQRPHPILLETSNLPCDVLFPSAGNPKAKVRGQIILIRRTSDQGASVSWTSI